MGTPQPFCLASRVRRIYHRANHRFSAPGTAFRVAVETMFYSHCPGVFADSGELLSYTVGIDAVPADLLAVLLRQKMQHTRHELEDVHRHLAVRFGARFAIDVLLEAEGYGLLSVINAGDILNIAIYFFPSLYKFAAEDKRIQYIQ